jgi:hypothetical protein
MRHYFQLMLTMTILALTAAPLTRADDSGLPDAPSASQNAANPSQTDREQATTLEVPASVQAGSNGLHEGVAPGATGGYLRVDRNGTGRSYWSLTGAMFSMSIANAELTERCEKEKKCNFLPSALSGRAGMYGVGIPADIVIAYMSYRLKKRNHRWLWIVPEAMSAGANFYVGLHSWNRLR